MGSAWVYGDNVDTDVIIPARYLTTSDERELAAHALEDLDSSFARGVAPGDVLFAGHNFGCGSSREHAATALRGAGVSAVIARSFARIFFRNAVNTGLVALVCEPAVDATERGDLVTVDVGLGEVKNHTRGATWVPEPLPDFIMDIVRAGGLTGWIRARRCVA